MRLLSLLLLALLASVSPVSAATYYVATTGNDGNAGTIGSPWLTVQHAASTMVAGDITYVRAGTYAENSITFANSGTAGNIITLRGFPSETAIIDAGFTTSIPPDGIGETPVFDIDGPDFITLSYLTIRRGRTVNIHISDDSTSTDITIDHCIIEDVTTGDNAASIYINTNSDNIVISNNLIDGRQPDLRSNVASGIIMFAALDVTIENNEIVDLIQGISSKFSGGPGQLIRNNLIHDINDFGILWNGHDAIISNNLLYDVAQASGYAGIIVFQDAGTCGVLVTDDNQILHNTIYNASNGIYIGQSATCVGAERTIVRDNIIAEFDGTEFRGIAISAYRSPDDLATTVTYNVVSSSVVSGTDAFVVTTYYDIGSLPGTVTHSNNNANAPTFVSSGTGDFTLAGGSVGESAASDGADTGVNMALVGIDAGSLSVPDAPTIGTATPGNIHCSVTFTPPGNDGGAIITSYTVTSSPSSLTGTGSGSPISVTGLSNGTAYTFTVTATNSEGTGAASSASNSCTPAAGLSRLRVVGG